MVVNLTVLIHSVRQGAITRLLTMANEHDDPRTVSNAIIIEPMSSAAAATAATPATRGRCTLP